MATAPAKTAWRTEAGSRAVLDMEIPEEDLARAMDRAYSTLVKRVNVPGFRRGKAPRPVLERHLGSGALREEALKDLLPERYAQAVEEAGLSPVGRPSFHLHSVEDGKGVRFTATVEVLPEIALPDYQGIRVTAALNPVREDEINALLADLQGRHGRMVSAPAQPAQRGDYALIAVVNGPPGLDRLQPGNEILVEIGGGLLPAEVESALEGVRAGEERHVALPEGTVDLSVVDVRRKELPPLDDAFARLVSDQSSMQTLRERLRERLARERADAEARDFRERVLDAVLAKVNIDLPESLVAHEIEHTLEDLDRRLQARGLSRETYLRSQGKDEAALRDDVRPAAERRVKVRLLLEGVAEQEGLSISEDEEADAVRRLAEESGESNEKMQAWLGQNDRRSGLRDHLLRQKALARLVAYAQGQDPSAASTSVPTAEGTAKAADAAAGEARGEA